MPFNDCLIPKYPEINTKQFTPMIAKLSINIFDNVLTDDKSFMSKIEGSGNVAPVKCTHKIIIILIMRSNSILLCLVFISY